MLLDASTPTTQPLGTRRAISEVVLPSPHPTSSTRSELVSSRVCNTSAAMACCKLERARYSSAFHSVVANLSPHFDLITANETNANDALCSLLMYFNFRNSLRIRTVRTLLTIEPSLCFERPGPSPPKKHSRRVSIKVA